MRGERGVTFIFAHVSINLLITSSKMSKTTQLSVSKHLSFPLRLSPHITLHIQNTRLETSTRSFLTIANPSASGSLSCLGSFVYAMPNVSILPFLVFSRHRMHEVIEIKNASGLNTVLSASASSIPSRYARPCIQFLVALTLQLEWLRPWQGRLGYLRTLAAV